MNIGKWTPLIALVIFLLIAAAKRVGTDRIPERWRWLRPIIMAALAEIGEMLLAGVPLEDAAMHGAWAAAGAMGIQGMVKEASPNPKPKCSNRNGRPQ